MQQLTFELAVPEPPGFSNFVTGPNGEVVAALRRIANGEGIDTGVVVWGGPGGGKTHLLRATVAAAQQAGRRATYARHAGEIVDMSPTARALVAVDDVHDSDAVGQGGLFTLYNALAASGGQLIAASSMAPARLALRDDLRTRLAHGLVYEVLPLADAEKAAALEAYARERGLRLTVDVIAYLLAHGRRDMASLVATLGALDRHSLSAKRAITVPLLREWLQHQGSSDRQR